MVSLTMHSDPILMSNKEIKNVNISFVFDGVTRHPINVEGLLLSYYEVSFFKNNHKILLLLCSLICQVFDTAKGSTGIPMLGNFYKLIEKLGMKYGY